MPIPAMISNPAGGGAPSGAAGGDLGGTYPNPTVASGANHTHTAAQISNSTAVGRSLVTAADAAAARTAIGAGGVTTYYADSFTAQPGAESASITGTGAASAATLVATITGRDYGTAGMTAARIVLPIPAGALKVDVAVQVTAWTGTVTGGWRYLTVAMRDSATGSNPTTLFGFGHGDGSACYYGNLLTGANGGLGPVTAASSLPAADRWIRCTFDTAPTSLALLSGTGVAGARPTTWAAPGTAIPLVASTSGTQFGSILDTTVATALVIVLQSFATTGGTNSVTIKPIVRVWT